MKSRPQFQFSQTLLLLVVLIVTPLVSAQETRTNSGVSRQKVSKAESGKVVLVRLTVDQEDVALKFARQHHPELADLLEQLRRNSRGNFNRGIREVHSAIQRLERFREKQPARFEYELQSWKTESEIRLRTAKWLMSKDPEQEKQIRELLQQRQVARIQRLKTEKEKLTERLSQLDQQIDRGTSELEADLANEWEKLTRRAATTVKAHRRSLQKPPEDSASPSKSKRTEKNRS